MANWIHDIEIMNFKSIRHQKIEDCRRVNVFIGYPNVGKSNILEALTALQIGKKAARNNHNFFRYEDGAEMFFQANTKEPAIVSYNNAQSVFVEFQNNNTVRFLATDYVENSKFLSFSAPETPSQLVDVYKYSFSQAKADDEASSYRQLQSPYGSNLFTVLREYPDIRKEVNEILERYGLRLLIDRTSNELKLIKSIDEDSIFQLPYSLLADTIQRLIFFQVAVRTNQESVLLFEEPEAHMFPPYVSKFTSDIIYDGRENQYFIATHSPFVLNDFMEDLDKEELSIYTVGYKKESGETIIRRLADEEITEIYQYGIDLFFNLENYLKDAV